MKKKIILLIAIISIVSLIGVLLYLILQDNEEPEIDIKTLSTIKGYDYKLSDNDTELFKNEFEELKKNLESSEINYEGYAKSIAKLFVIDLYTINNKKNKYDIGGTEFVYPENIDNYSLNVGDTIYKYVEDNSKGNRKQELPEVSTINIVELNKDKFKYEKTEYEAYKIKLEWNYVNDYGYDSNGIVTIIKDENKLYVVEKE